MGKPGLRPIDELVRLAMIGDGAAFTELWDTNIDALRTYIKGTMKSLDDFYVDDICSKSFEKAFRQISTYDPSKSRFSTWLRTIAHNTALDLIEQESRLRKKYVSIDNGSGEVYAIESIGDEADTALETIIKDEDAETIDKYIEGLPELYREIARLRLVEGWSYKEIADKLSLELNTVRTRIRRAKAMIEKMKDD